MSRFDKITKWLLITITTIFVLYTLLWVVITYTIANDLEKEFGGKKYKLSEDASLSFKRVKASGFPFKFMLEIHDFVEENDTAVITHKRPLRVGYDILSQTIFSEYSGESITRYKPVNSLFGAKVEGKYRVQAKVPFNLTLLKVLLLQAEPVEMINYVNDFQVRSRDVYVHDLIDKSVIIADADLDIKFSIDNHDYYDTVDELVSDIPNDYHFSFSAKTKDAIAGRKPIPFSLVYWSYLPTDFSYDIDIDFHTDAKQFDMDDIFRNFSFKTNKMEFYTKMESSKSNLKIDRVAKSDEEGKLTLKYDTKLKFGSEFTDYLTDSIESYAQKIPPNSPLIIMKEFIKKMDLSQLDFNTKEDDLKLALEASIHNVGNAYTFEVPNISAYFKDKGIDVKVILNNSMKGEWLSGVLQISHMDGIIDYFTETIFKVNKSRNNPLMMSDIFWKDLYNDYFKSIANSYNEENGSAIIEFKVNRNVEKSVFGKFSATEATLLYYKKLYRHLIPYTSNKSERLNLFRKMIPNSIDSPEIMEKVTKE